MTKRKPPKNQSASSAAAKKSPLPPPVGVTSTKEPAVNWKWLGILILVIGVVPFCLYANTFGYGLVFNDHYTMMRLLTDYNVATPFDGLLRPFTQPWIRSSYMLDIRHYKDGYGWYHLVSVWVHLSAAVALGVLTLIIARKTFKREGDPVMPYTVAGLAGLIYACHPLAVQTATYVSARWSGLGAANFLWALVFFALVLHTAGAIRVWCFVSLIVFSAMCLASSEVVLALAPSMVALYYLLKPAKFTWTEWALEHPVFTALTTVFSLSIPFYLFTGFSPVAAPNTYGLPMLSWTAYYATQAKAFLTYYTRAFFTPVGLSIDPPFSQATNFSDVMAIGGLILVILLACAMYRWRAQRLLFFGMWLTVAGYLPHALIRQQDAVSDPAFYLSLAGLSLIATWALSELFRGPFSSVVPKMVAVVAILAGLSVWHNLNFANDDKLVQATLQSNHRSVLGTIYAANQKIEKGEFEAAIKDADEAISIDPTSGMGYYIRGKAQLRAARYSEAKHSLEKASDLAWQQRLPILPSVKYALAESYIHMDTIEPATRVAQEAFSLNPSDGRGRYVMGLLALKKKDYPMAMQYLSEAMRRGVTESRLPAARVLLGMKDYDSAYQLASRLTVEHNEPEAQLILGNAALAREDLAAAEKALKEALKASPHNAEAMALLAILYERKGDKVLAESYHKDAMQRDSGIFGKLLLPPKPAEKPAAPVATRPAAPPTKKP
jgi:Flp pilus assembly protein TadD